MAELIVSTETIRPAKPKILIIWSFPESLLTPHWELSNYTTMHFFPPSALASSGNVLNIQTKGQGTRVQKLEIRKRTDWFISWTQCHGANASSSKVLFATEMASVGWVNRSPSLLGLCVSPESLHGWLSCLKSPFPPYHEQAWQKLKAALVTWGPSFYLPPDLSSHHCPNNSLSFDLAVSRSHLFLGNQWIQNP